MFLFFARLQRHHEALNALGFLVQRHDRGRKNGQQAVLDRFGLDLGQHGPRQHISPLRQRGKRAIGAVHAGTTASRNAACSRRPGLCQPAQRQKAGGQRKSKCRQLNKNRFHGIFLNNHLILVLVLHAAKLADGQAFAGGL